MRTLLTTLTATISDTLHKWPTIVRHMSAVLSHVTQITSKQAYLRAIMPLEISEVTEFTNVEQQRRSVYAVEIQAFRLFAM